MTEFPTIAEAFGGAGTFLLMLPVAWALMKAGQAAYRSAWLWRHKGEFSDPVIAKAVQGVKPPPYLLYALAYLLGAAGLYFLAYQAALATR